MLARDMETLTLLREGLTSAQSAFGQLVEATATEITALRHETLSHVDTARGFLIQCAIMQPLFPPSCQHSGGCTDNDEFELRFRMFAPAEFLARQILEQLEEVVIKLNVLEEKVSKLACPNAAEMNKYFTKYHILSLDYGIHRLREGQKRLDLWHSQL